MNEGTRSGKSTIRLLGISAERPTNGLYLLPYHPEEVCAIGISLRVIPICGDKMEKRRNRDSFTLYAF
jgi:hypothetical protein